MANPLANLSNYCCRVTVTTTATPLATLIRNYFTTNYPNTFFPEVNAVTANIQNSNSSTATVYIGDVAPRLMNVGTGLGVGDELPAGNAFFFPWSGGGRQSIDFNAYSVAVAAGSAILNIVCNGG